jgi:hypothetical protein
MTAATVTDGGCGATLALEWACEWLQAASTVAKIAVKMKAVDRKYMVLSPKMTLVFKLSDSKTVYVSYW